MPVMTPAIGVGVAVVRWMCDGRRERKEVSEKVKSFSGPGRQPRAGTSPITSLRIHQH
jgi:hypothetical protein